MQFGRSFNPSQVLYFGHVWWVSVVTVQLQETLPWTRG